MSCRNFFTLQSFFVGVGTFSFSVCAYVYTDLQYSGKNSIFGVISAENFVLFQKLQILCMYSGCYRNKLKDYNLHIQENYKEKLNKKDAFKKKRRII